MHILTGKNWIDGYLDYPLLENYVRVTVYSWANIAEVDELYFKRSFNLKNLWEYLKEIGIISVFRKICSRLNEKNRNEKFFSIGIGRIVESAFSKLQKNIPVVFVAPVFPKSCERIALPHYFVLPCSEQLIKLHFNDKNILFYAKEKVIQELPLEKILDGFDPNSGIKPDMNVIENYLHKVINFWETTKLLPDTKLTVTYNNDIKTTFIPNKIKENKFTAALFGLGNYAKSQLLPNLNKNIQVKEIHEIDPTQLGIPSKYNCIIKTSPEFETIDQCDILFAASYHHTHAELAYKAIKSGMTAVIEKPIVTTFKQLKSLLEIDEKFPGKLFSCYHMRYNELYFQAKKDLQTEKDQPIHIMADVFEVPLPKKHWYRWPNSHSHIVSNGCHWIDHFLFMNNYSKPVKIDLKRLSNADSISTVELENGACLCLHLTHHGSPRIGVQDKITMRCEKRTVTVINGSTYEFEDEICMQRKFKKNRMNAYSNMYKKITEAIINGKHGDSREMIEYTNNVILTLDKYYLEQAQEPKK